MSRRDEIIQKALALPHMPMAVQQLLTLMQSQDADIEEVIRLIEFDPGLTVSLLSMANSSYFDSPSHFTSIRDALNQLGVNTLVNMVVSFGVAPYTKNEIKGYGLAHGELLAHAVATAIAARELAAKTGIHAPQHTFTAGLLINIGKTALGAFLEVSIDPILELAYEEGLSFDQAEKRILGVNHAELGALLLQHWGIPEPIVNVVRHHRCPDRAPAPDTALDLVHAGDMLAKMTGIGAGIDGMHYTFSESVIQRLSLTPQIMEAVLLALPEKVAEAVAVFS